MCLHIVTNLSFYADPFFIINKMIYVKIVKIAFYSPSPPPRFSKTLGWRERFSFDDDSFDFIVISSDLFLFLVVVSKWLKWYSPQCI